MKSKTKFIFLSIKRNILPMIFCLFIFFLVIFSKSNLVASKSGLLLWANNIVPSLLPFFIATELLSYTNVITKLGKILNPIMKPVFNVPGVGSYALIMGIISGYPTGAKIVVDLNKNGLCSNEESERLLAFTNNSGPLFILGTVGISLFGNTQIGFLLLITHILSCISVGIVFRFWKINSNSHYNINKYNYSNIKTDNICFSNLGDILSKSIISSVKTIVMIGGFVVLFSVILSILKNSNFLILLGKFLFPIFNFLGIKDFEFTTSFISGCFELTNGLLQLINIPSKLISTNIVLSSFLLGFGGISVLLQVNSIIAKSRISIKPYIYGKLLHGLFAAFYTLIFIYSFPIFNLNL
ncbi:MAG: sporulation integral membrane protein YlbJ [Clostridiaceae bacterium]|nr:sporulation integral membrane protein YlbJ [Clostridiaceae bacterium]